MSERTRVTTHYVGDSCPDEHQTEQGSVSPFYDVDGITIYNADCRDVLPHLEADVLVTDPPYGIDCRLEWARGGKSGESPWAYDAIEGDEDTALRDEVLTGWDGPALVFGSWKRPAPAATRAVLVWDKGPASGMGDLSIPWKPSWEAIYLIGSGFEGRRDEGVLKGYTVVTWTSKGRQHPNEKPVDLMRHLIGKCPDGVIVDPFMGSGTTLRAAKDLSRRAIGIEVEEKWCRVAVDRLAQGVLPLEAL